MKDPCNYPSSRSLEAYLSLEQLSQAPEQARVCVFMQGWSPKAPLDEAGELSTL